TISDTRQALKTEMPDFLLLDYRVSDGDGIEFAAEIARQHGNSIPVVVVTGEGDETTAIRSIRSGVVDYLPKNALSLELFESAVSSAIVSRFDAPKRRVDDIEQVEEELRTLRSNTRRNMHLAKTYMLPMAGYAWKAIQSLSGEERKVEASNLLTLTQRLTGMLDETLIGSFTDCSMSNTGDVDLREVVDCVLAQDEIIGAAVEVHGHQAFPIIQANWSQILLMVSELLQYSMRSVPSDKEARIVISAACDPDHNPILKIVDNGAPTSSRQNALRGVPQALENSANASAADGYTLSMCQRLAELNAGSLRVSDAKQGGCVTMIRFCKDLE
ncbi:MAG: response regulator, partial [Paracoccaceae bacterium]